MVFCFSKMRIIEIIVFSLLIKLSLSYHQRSKRIVGGRPAKPPPADDPVVFARMYNRDARVKGFHNNATRLYSFLGIHYAYPPIGRNRFTRPIYRRLEGDIDATNYGSPCPQPSPSNPNFIVGNEDCLLLNIYTPQLPDETTLLPVYVWIHGGGFRYGSASQYGGEPLAQSGLIVVTIQYRLGSLGIIGEGNKDFTGNIAMFDMTAALRWVTEYISFFGGNSKQIKVIGHGSGGASAMYLTMSKLPRSESIDGVVSMSGSAISQYAMDDSPVQSLEEIAIINGCNKTKPLEIINCMRLRSYTDIIQSDSKVQTERLQGRAMVKAIAGSAGFGPHKEEVDDNRYLPGFLTENPAEVLKTNRFKNIPLLIGVTKHETANAIKVEHVEKIWGNAGNFLSSLHNNLVGLKTFLKLDKVSGKILKSEIPGFKISLEEFLKVPNSWNPFQVLSKLTETTTDLLFNLPAVISADTWGKSGPAFLYSFDYSGGSSGGKHFLRGLPIIENSYNNFTAHGDELKYLFDANDIFGNPIHEIRLSTTKEVTVRQTFINLLKNFAHMKIDEDGKPEGNIFRHFSGKGTPFIKITDKIELENDFRLCQLSLWGASLEAFKAISCNNILNSFPSISGVSETLSSDIVNNLGGILVSNNGGKNAGGSIGGGILGNGGGSLLSGKNVGAFLGGRTSNFQYNTEMGAAAIFMRPKNSVKQIN